MKKKEGKKCVFGYRVMMERGEEEERRGIKEEEKGKREKSQCLCLFVPLSSFACTCNLTCISVRGEERMKRKEEERVQQ